MPTPSRTDTPDDTLRGRGAELLSLDEVLCSELPQGAADPLVPILQGLAHGIAAVALFLREANPPPHLPGRHGLPPRDDPRAGTRHLISLALAGTRARCAWSDEPPSTTAAAPAGEPGAFRVVLDDLDAPHVEDAGPAGLLFAVYGDGPGATVSGANGHGAAASGGNGSGRGLPRAAGAAVLGSHAVLLLCAGAGTHLFRLDRDSGEIVEAAPPLRIPSPGWQPVPPPPADWPLAAILYRVLRRGGALELNPVRPLHQAVPIAVLTEQAGGAAFDGTGRILDRILDPGGSAHRRTDAQPAPDPSEESWTSLVFGAPELVEGFPPLMAPTPAGLFHSGDAPLFGRRGLFRS